MAHFDQLHIALKFELRSHFYQDCGTMRQKPLHHLAPSPLTRLQL